MTEHREATKMSRFMLLSSMVLAGCSGTAAMAQAPGQTAVMVPAEGGENAVVSWIGGAPVQTQVLVGDDLGI